MSTLIISASICVGALLVAWLACRRSVPLGSALIVHRRSASPQVVLDGSVQVIPGWTQAETMRLTVHPLRLRLEGATGLSCRDHIRADLEATFLVRVNPVSEDLLKVARELGCEGASDSATLEQLFSARFIEALRLVGKRLDYDELLSRRDDVRDQVLEVCGLDLDGFRLDGASIDHLEQTPLSKLDPSHRHDAQGIRKITEQTAAEAVATKRAELERDRALLELQQEHAVVRRKLH